MECDWRDDKFDSKGDASISVWSASNLSRGTLVPVHDTPAMAVPGPLSGILSLHHQWSPTSTTSSEEIGPCCLSFIWSFRTWRKPEKCPIRCWSKYLSSIALLLKHCLHTLDKGFWYPTWFQVSGRCCSSWEPQHQPATWLSFKFLSWLRIFAFNSMSGWPHCWMGMWSLSPLQEMGLFNISNLWKVFKKTTLGENSSSSPSLLTGDAFGIRLPGWNKPTSWLGVPNGIQAAVVWDLVHTNRTARGVLGTEALPVPTVPNPFPIFTLHYTSTTESSWALQGMANHWGSQERHERPDERIWWQAEQEVITFLLLSSFCCHSLCGSEDKCSVLAAVSGRFAGLQFITLSSPKPHWRALWS